MAIHRGRYKKFLTWWQEGETQQKTMRDVIETYKQFTRWKQVAIIAGIFISGLLLLPNTIMYAAAAFASYKLIDRKTWKYIAVSTFSLITFFSGILWIAGDTSQPITDNSNVETTLSQTNEQSEAVPAKTTDTVSIGEETQNNDEATSQSIVETNTTDTNSTPVAPTESSSTYGVVEVVDGDTVKLSINGTVETVRLIGIDTPESVHPTEPVECFGVEASDRAKQLLSDKQVEFETDSSQDTRDRYGRLLGYIILPDGRNFNKVMIEDGYAYEYTYDKPYKYQAEFKAAQSSAEANQHGLWAAGACESPEEEEQVPAQTTNPSDDKWYTSSHHSAKYYYHESCDGWQGLSTSYLSVYTSEAALLAEHSAHTLHPDCNPN